jgi:DnaA-homolog protein
VTQLVLDLGPPPAPSFENFVAGDNVEAFEAMRALVPAGCPPSGARAPASAPASVNGDRFLYLWGTPGSGRSHLLQALRAATFAAGRGARLLGPQSPLEDFGVEPSVRAWLIDDCDGLDADRQAAVFHLFNAVQADAATLLASAGSEPPARLALIPELTTRLGWGLVLQLKPLSDRYVAQALSLTLAERGVNASSDLIPWLMSHSRRNLGELRALIDTLDRYALERKRPITLPLLRELLQRRLL